MPATTRAQRRRNDEVDTARDNEASRGRATRGRGARGARGRGRGRATRGGRSGFIQASDLPANYQGGQPPQQAQQVEPKAARLRIAFWPWDIQYPVEYDFNMDDALMEVRGLPSGHLFNDFELEEYINERLADYEYARAEMPAEHPLFHMENELQTLYRFYPDVDWLQMPALPRICSKTKCHVEGQVVRAPFKHQGQTCTFTRHNLRNMRCDLCTGDQKAAFKLGKERENQVRRLKIQWMQEQDVARREELMTQMTHLLQGTLRLDAIVYSNRFVLVTANHLKMADDSFTTEESIDFILRCFVEGFVRGRGQPLTEAQRQEYFQRLDTESFHCTHTGRRLQFFRSFMPDMASPDRLVFVDRNSLDYSDPNQVTVRCSWWSNMFFGAEPDRDDYLRRLSQPYLNADNSLDFVPIFTEMNGIIRQFLANSPQERNQLHRNVACLVPIAKVKQIFKDINRPFRPHGCGARRYQVNDFHNWQEVQSFFKAYRSRCVVSGLNGQDFTISLDRKIDTTGRYNWTDINPMLWSINAAKSSFRFAFESDADLQTWFDEHHEEYDDLVNQTLDACADNRNIEEIESALEEMRQTWVIVVEMRKYFCALLEHYRSHANPQFYHDFTQQ